MQVTVKLFAYFRDNRFAVGVSEYPEHTTTVGDVVDKLGIDRDEIGITMINSRHCQLETVLQADDTLAIFPVIGGG